jgi:hypothetical protein
VAPYRLEQVRGSNRLHEYCRRAEELRALTESRDAVRSAHDALRKRRLEEFMSGFNAISLKLKEMYQMITLGGDAELELVDSLDPFSEGIVFSVRPPKKSWKNICNVSSNSRTFEESKKRANSLREPRKIGFGCSNFKRPLFIIRNVLRTLPAKQKN